jgi:hypothetical protein
MKKLLVTGAVFTALVGPATAADLARPVYRRPVVVVAPVYTRTGFYVGGYPFVPTCHSCGVIPCTNRKCPSLGWRELIAQ